MSVKKKLPRQPLSRVDTKAIRQKQSASDRKAADVQLNQLIAKSAPPWARLVASLRKLLRKRLPTAFEVGYEYRDCVVISFSPNEKGYAGVLAVRASPIGVKLYFNNGKELPDPGRLLQGTGKQARSIDLQDMSTLARPEVVRLIEEAVARSRVPFARSGRGAILIRSSSAKPKRRPNKPVS